MGVGLEIGGGLRLTDLRPGGECSTGEKYCCCPKREVWESKQKEGRVGGEYGGKADEHGDEDPYKIHKEHVTITSPYG